ncbi:MAG TPA: A24 family peptidase [Candidatus Acidoferrales bacterium]|nr:A24 family peptidase [Candidatus Acidoferrales bacterium]
MIHLNTGVWALTLALTLSAGLIDAWTHRIPNWLTVSGFLAGIAVNSAIGGPKGTTTALEGAGLGLLILLPLVFLRALGAGDLKLVGALGAFLGPSLLWLVLLASVLVAGLMAAVLAIRAKRVRETLRNMGMLITGFLTFGLRAPSDVSLDNPRLLKLPFGVAVAIGTLVCFVAARRGL